MALNPKQNLFVKYYIREKNATKAAILAGYSKRAAAQIGEKLLRKDELIREVEKGLAAQAKRVELSADAVLQELKKIAFVKLKDAYRDDGVLLNPHEMPEDVQSALSQMETDEIFVGKGDSRKKIGETKKIKLSDKVRALEMLGKHFKLFTEIQEITGKDGGPQVIITLPGNGRESADGNDTNKN